MKYNYLTNSLRVYSLIYKLAFGEILEYRLSTLFKIVRYPLSIWLIYFFWRSVETGRGFVSTDLVTYFLLANIFFSWSNFHTYFVEDDIRLGHLNRLITRPINIFMYYFSYQSAGVFTSVVIQTLLALFLGLFIHPTININPWSWLLVGLYFIFIYLFSFLLFYTMSLCSVWLTEMYALRWSYMGVMRFLTGLYIPINYFPETLKNILFWTPLPHLAGTPISLIQNEISIHSGLEGLTVLLGWIFVIFIIYKYVSILAFHAYEGNGG